MTKNAEKLTISEHSDRELIMTRVFRAPRQLVYDAHTKPELLKRWLGVRGGWSLAVCEIDLRVGGAYRWVWRKDATGAEMGMGGVYRELVPPERIVCTELFDDAWYSGEALSTTAFIEEAGATTLTVTMRYESREARDGVLKSGIERGVSESYDQLAELLSPVPTST